MSIMGKYPYWPFVRCSDCKYLRFVERFKNKDYYKCGRERSEYDERPLDFNNPDQLHRCLWYDGKENLKVDKKVLKRSEEKSKLYEEYLKK